MRHGKDDEARRTRSRRDGKLRCAVVGLGRIGSLLEDDALREKPCTHAGAITGNPECILVGGCDTDPERRRLFAERWNCDAVFASADDLLRETKPDILHIATHPDSHYLYVKMAAASGVGVAVCEKPLADGLAAARRIAALHSSGAVTVLTNHERRYSEDYRRARSRVADGTYGRLLSISSKLYFGRTRKLVSQLVHDGTHLADIVAFLAGGTLKKTAVTGNLLKASGTAFIAAVCRLDDEGPAVRVSIEVGAERDHLVFESDLSFEKGRIRIGNGIYEEWRSVPSPYYEGFRSLGPEKAPVFEKTGYFENMMKDAAACARDRARQPVSSAVDGLAALRFILSL